MMNTERRKWKPGKRFVYLPLFQEENIFCKIFVNVNVCFLDYRQKKMKKEKRQKETLDLMKIDTGVKVYHTKGTLMWPYAIHVSRKRNHFVTLLLHWLIHVRSTYMYNTSTLYFIWKFCCRKTEAFLAKFEKEAKENERKKVLAKSSPMSGQPSPSLQAGIVTKQIMGSMF